MNKQINKRDRAIEGGMSYSVLVTDDSSFMRTLLSSIFKSIPEIKEIREAINGVKSIEMYKQDKTDFITMDIDMPEMNGLEAAKQIKLFDPNAKIVMVSSSKKTQDIEKADEIGVDGYITKPFDRLEIKEIVENITK